MNFYWKTFGALSTTELYAILNLREQVFILEQQSLYNDIDGLDTQAEHLLCYQGARLIAYLRLLTRADKIKIGRVVVVKEKRAAGIGATVVRKAITKAAEIKAALPLYLSAQVDSQAFYRRMGFRPVSTPYDDGGILHIDMVRDPTE